MLSQELFTIAFQEMLDMESGDLWAAITFRKPTSPVRAKLKIKSFLNKLDRKSKYYNNYITVWTFYEKGSEFDEHSGKGVHVHAIIKGISSSLVKEVEKEANRFFGNSKVILVHEGVPRYLAKKHIRGRLADFDKLKINSHYKNNV